jgi:hypothetical protein
MEAATKVTKSDLAKAFRYWADMALAYPEVFDGSIYESTEEYGEACARWFLRCLAKVRG